MPCVDCWLCARQMEDTLCQPPPLLGPRVFCQNLGATVLPLTISTLLGIEWQLWGLSLKVANPQTVNPGAGQVTAGSRNFSSLASPFSAGPSEADCGEQPLS